MDASYPEQITPVVEADFGLDGGAMFGVIPKPIWNRTNPADDRNRIDLATRCLIVEYGDRCVVVDAGIGQRWEDKHRERFKIKNRDPRLRRGLDEVGRSPDEVDDVIMTHLHFDHAGGLAYRSESGIQPSFPRATHWVQRRHWEWAQEPSPRDAGSFRHRDFDFLEQSDTRPDLELIEGTTEIAPGIEVYECDGHTAGMQIVKITLQTGQTFLYMADLVPTSGHIKIPYVMGYDIQPLETVEEKRDHLYRAAQNDWILVFEHDPETAFARIEYDGSNPPKIEPTDYPE